MQIYSSEDIARIRKRLSENPDFVKNIEDETANVRRKLIIQKSGLATWGHYFSCPKCGGRLTYDYDCNEHFDCSNCGEVVSGEPYLGAWWEYILDVTVEAAFKLALIAVGAGKTEYLELVKKILLGYADNYCNYEVHGGIPYNNPGRFAAQVLSDTHPIYNLARAYALVKEEFSEAEREHIENDLFRAAAEHQIKYLTPQIHNHEVVICGSIAAVGFAIDDRSLVEYALNAKYGIKYQIDHSYLDDSLWFEGSLGYHYYSLRWFMIYEMMAKNTPEYSLFADEHYREKLYSAIMFPEKVNIGNRRCFKFNDGGGYFLDHSVVYEYAYAYFRREELLPFLKACYIKDGRKNDIYAIIYGVDTLPENIPEIKKEFYLAKGGSNLAVLRGSNDGYFAFKAFPYGGEHDHYDRLSVSFSAFGKPVSEDFGTASGYGSPLHYGYFKNTASHNTVVIDGENMAPCDTVVNEYRIDAPDDVYLDAETLPPEDYKMLDSFTIKQWSDEAYRGVRMRRIISWHDKYFIDVFSVKSDNELRKEWTMHIDGKLVSPKEGRYINGISSKGAQSYIKNAYINKGEGIVKCEYTHDDYKVDIHALVDGLEMVYAEGPNNPADKNVSYLLERTYAKCPVYVNVVEMYKDSSVIANVEASVKDEKVFVTVTEVSGKVRKLEVRI